MTGIILNKMTKNKISCSLQNWLRKYDKKLYEAAEDACVLGLLNPGRFGGITFLYPVDKTLHKKLITGLGNNDMEGVNMFRSMIITDYLPTAEDWMRKKDDIPNRLGLKVMVEKGERQKITLKNKAVIEPLADFVAREDRKNMCVWKYKGDAMPLTGDKAERKYTKKGAPQPPKKTGGFFRSKITPACLAKMCEAKAAAYMKMGTRVKNNAHLDSLCSYLCFMEKHYPAELNKMLCSLGYCVEASFYNIFEPYVTNSRPFMFDEWIDKTKGVCLEISSAEKYLQFVNAAIEKAAELRVNTGNEREKILDNRMPQTLRKELLAIYNRDLSLYGPLYSNGLRKAMHDETRFIIDDKMVEIISRNDHDALKDLFFEIECMQRSGYKNGTYIITTTLDYQNDKNDIAGFYSTAVAFLLSDCFLFSPYDCADEQQIKDLAHDENGASPTLIPLYNVQLRDFMGENVLFVTEEPCKHELSALTESQTKEGNNVQNAFAQVLNLVDDPKKLTPELLDAVKRIHNMESST